MPSEICRHIKTNGERCGSPALRGASHCFFHRNLNRKHRPAQPELIETVLHSALSDGPNGLQREPQTLAAPAQQTPLELPPLEDRESIQVAISLLVGALASGRLEPKRAALLLYGLQVASANARHLRLGSLRDEVVRRTVTEPDGTELAPDEDPPSYTDYKRFRAALDAELPG